MDAEWNIATIIMIKTCCIFSTNNADITLAQPNISFLILANFSIFFSCFDLHMKFPLMFSLFFR